MDAGLLIIESLFQRVCAAWKQAQRTAAFQTPARRFVKADGVPLRSAHEACRLVRRQLRLGKPFNEPPRPAVIRHEHGILRAVDGLEEPPRRFKGGEQRPFRPATFCGDSGYGQRGALRFC